MFVIDDAIKHKIQLQDYKNQKIDAVIELPDGQWCAFEIKLGANQIDSAAANLLALKKQIIVKNDLPPSLRRLAGGHFLSFG